MLNINLTGNREYKITDHLGSTRAIVDSNGYVLSSYDYEPFGKILAQIGNDSRKSFIDKEKDVESGLGNFGVRQYDGNRFTSVDALWEKFRGWSPYQYSYNNPLRFRDGNGLIPGDLFVTPFQAAHDFGKNYNPLSINFKLEIGTSIYEVNKDGKTFYTYTIPNLGTDGGVDIKDPKGEKTVARAHSHGAYDYKYENNIFSDQDIETANKMKQKSYIITPEGSIKEYDPKTGNKPVTKSIDMPSDPKDPDRKNNKDPKTEETRPLPFIYKNEVKEYKKND